MSYWKCSTWFYLKPIMRVLSNQNPTSDLFTLARECVFFKLLNCCADNHEFENAESFSKLIGAPIKICETVWNICIENNVLRKTKNGYSVLEWMVDECIFESSSEQGVVVKESEPEKPKPKPRKNAKEDKIAARPNVFLTESELKQLKEEFTDEQVTLMVDKLSDYKYQNPYKHYASDFDAIKRWVIKWLKNGAYQKPKVFETHEEFPDWITGKNK